MDNDANRLFYQIRDLILSARNIAARSVDTLQVMTNFEIGRQIVEHEQMGTRRAGYGKLVLKELSEKLADEFGKGFSLTNLKMMRLFYLMNKERIGQTPSAKLPPSPNGQTASDQLRRHRKKELDTRPSRNFTLSWSHYVFLMKIRDPDERSFYEIEAGQQDWALRELKRQFNSGLYERLALSRDQEGINNLPQWGYISQPRVGRLGPTLGRRTKKPFLP